MAGWVGEQGRATRRHADCVHRRPRGARGIPVRTRRPAMGGEPARDNGRSEQAAGALVAIILPCWRRPRVLRPAALRSDAMANRLLRLARSLRGLVGRRGWAYAPAIRAAARSARHEYGGVSGF